MKGVFFFIAIFVVQHSMYSWVVLTSLFNQIVLNSNTSIRAHIHIHTPYASIYLWFNWSIHLCHLIETVFDGNTHAMGRERERKNQFVLNMLPSIVLNSRKYKSSRLKTRKFINSAACIDNNCISTNLQKTKERYIRKHPLRDKAN